MTAQHWKSGAGIAENAIIVRSEGAAEVTRNGRNKLQIIQRRRFPDGRTTEEDGRSDAVLGPSSVELSMKCKGLSVASRFNDSENSHKQMSG